MPYDPLVSESESSSGAASPTHQSAQSLLQLPLGESTHLSHHLNSPRSLPQPASREETPNIKNEDIPTKVTLSASIMISKLPPESSRVISRITEPTNIKITVRCQPIGSAPELTPNVFKISYHQPFATLSKFVTKKLKKKLPNKGETIYLYVNNSFAPSPDEIIGHLHSHFAANGELVVSYCTVVAFG